MSYRTFENGKLRNKLKTSKKQTKKKHGTYVLFKANEKYFDSLSVNIKELIHLVKAKSILQPNLKMIIVDNKYGTGRQEFYHQGDLKDYLISSILPKQEYLPSESYFGSIESGDYYMEWSAIWLCESSEPLQESYVNLIPTIYGGTHVNAFRSGVVDAMREFCDGHNLLPKNLKFPE